MSPLAEKTMLGWSISGFSSPDAPTSAEVLNGDALLLESNVVLSRSQPDPFHIDEDSVFLSPARKSLDPPQGEEEKIEEMLDCVAMIATASGRNKAPTDLSNMSGSQSINLDVGNSDQMIRRETDETQSPISDQCATDQFSGKGVDSFSHGKDSASTTHCTKDSSREDSSNNLVTLQSDDDNCPEGLGEVDALDYYLKKAFLFLSKPTLYSFADLPENIQV